MIIFDLDGTLADCDHRRHFVVPTCSECKGKINKPNDWKPHFKKFYEECDKDNAILPTVNLIMELHSFTHGMAHNDVHIWSGRCYSTRVKTEKWLNDLGITYCDLKMRPRGDSTPDEVLKENWLDEAILSGKTIEYVFDDRPKVIRMWRRRGIFVFNCCQNDDEF